jgi:hypothetical protein
MSNDRGRNLEDQIEGLRNENLDQQNEMCGIKKNLSKLGEAGAGVQAALDSSCSEV